MERRSLGKTDIDVRVIGMGTWGTFDVPLQATRELGRRTAIVREALSLGVNFFDSSPMYGSAEAVLGKTLGGKRESAVVATKVWSHSVPEGLQQIQRGLEYFGGYVDVYQVHNLVEWQRYLPILRSLQAKGTVKAVGITHYVQSAFGEMERIMEHENIQTIQIPYNAANGEASERILSLAVELNIGVIVLSPLGSGDLVRRAPDPGELKPLAEFGVETWAQALLKWVVSDERVSVAIPATSRPGRMTENARAGTPPFFGPEERQRVAWLARRTASVG
jgi:aryl-alcohol dehydrogenase-like predicted oxidoreductase